MNGWLAIAGLVCLLMAIGHAVIGVVWVLPSLKKDSLPTTPFGPSSLTESMLRVTWYIVTIFVLAIGAILLTFAWADDLNAESMVLRWFAAMWLLATAMAAVVSLPRVRTLRGFLRLPVPVLWLAVAVICWRAAG